MTSDYIYKCILYSTSTILPFKLFLLEKISSPALSKNHSHLDDITKMKNRSNFFETDFNMNLYISLSTELYLKSIYPITP